jgi:hypothetical protein
MGLHGPLRLWLYCFTLEASVSNGIKNDGFPYWDCLSLVIPPVRMQVQRSETTRGGLMPNNNSQFITVLSYALYPRQFKVARQIV